MKFQDHPIRASWDNKGHGFKKRLIEAGRELTMLLRHRGPKPPRLGGYWLAADSGGWITILDLLTNGETTSSYGPTRSLDR